MSEVRGHVRYNLIIVLQFLLLLITSALGKNNILLIIADDLRPSIGCYGDSNAYTPNIDQLSQESVLFSKAYTQQALCAPSRNSFLTSRRPDTLHLYDFYSYWREFAGNFTTLPQYFKEHGYFTKSIGKVFHPGESSNWTDDQPYSWSVPAYHPPTEAFKEAAVCRGTRRDLVCPVTPRLQPGGTLPDLQSVREARRFIREGVMLEQPFLLAVGFHKPHVPLKYPRKYLKYHPLDNVSLPVDTWPPVGLPSVAWNPWTDVRAREDIAALNISFPFGQIPDKWSRKIRQSYYAAVTYIDDLIGQLIRDFKSTGLYGNTIIALIGDHGWSLGENGEWSKFGNYEAAVRVPMLVRVPGLTGAGAVVAAPVELLDLFPTLADAAGLPGLPPCPARSHSVRLCTQGLSLMPAIYKTVVNNETVTDIGKPAMSQYPRPGVYPTAKPNSDKPRLAQIRYMGYSLRTAQFRYTEWPRWAWGGGGPDWGGLAGAELYDHSLDPGENMNLADRPMLRETRARLSRQLQALVGLADPLEQ